jgi:hypothetical protein
MGWYYDKQGERLDDMLGWARLVEDNEYKLVEQTEVGEAFVSTVWMGIDHNFASPGNPPLIFETMIFGGDHDECQWRWATEEEARKAHRMIVEKLIAEHSQGAQT